MNRAKRRLCCENNAKFPEFIVFVHLCISYNHVLSTNCSKAFSKLIKKTSHNINTMIFLKIPPIKWARFLNKN